MRLKRREPKVIHYRVYRSGDGGAVDVPGYELQRPTRAPTWESDVLVPLAQGLVTGAILGTAAVVVLWATAGVALWPTWPALVAGAMGLAWLWRMNAVGETLWTVERVLHADLDGDGEIGEPERAHIVTIHANGAKLSDPAADLRADWVRFVQGCCVGDTSLRRWEKAGMSRERYQEFRDKLIEAGFAEWKNGDKRQGWRMTAPANHVIERIM